MSLLSYNKNPSPTTIPWYIIERGTLESLAGEPRKFADFLIDEGVWAIQEDAS